MPRGIWVVFLVVYFILFANCYQELAEKLVHVSSRFSKQEITGIAQRLVWSFSWYFHFPVRLRTFLIAESRL